MTSTTNEITIRQNQPLFIELLKAQRVLYSESSKLPSIKIIEIALSFLLPYIALFNSTLEKYLVITGVVLTILYYLTKRKLKNKKKIAANIQEQFDTQLFGISWNDILCEKKIPENIIKVYAQKCNDEMDGWYTSKITTNITRDKAVLLCQLENLSWQLNLRNRYSFVLLVILAIQILSIVLTAIFLNKVTSIPLILLPSIVPFVDYVFGEWRVSNSQKDLIERITSLFQSSNIADATLRQLQDGIYIFRRDQEKIPDTFYEIFKDLDETEADIMIENSIQKYNLKRVEN